MARLNDEDGFVVSKAIAAFSEGYNTPPVSISDLRNALDSAVTHHPELARNVFQFAVEKSWIGAEYNENLQRFCHHDVTVIRAAAIASLVSLRKEAAFPDVQESLNDVEDEVRTSALNALAKVIREQVRDAFKEALDHPKPIPAPTLILRAPTKNRQQATLKWLLKRQPRSLRWQMRSH